MRGRLGKQNKSYKPLQRYFIFSEGELLSLIVCIILDISEYMAVILVLPVVGDLLDLAGIIVCLSMFRWVGLVSLLELVPGADILPIFIITWLMGYLLKKLREKEKQQVQKKWISR